MRTTSRLILLSIALFSSLAISTTPAQAAPGQGEEGIVKLAESNIEYFSRGEGEPIVLLPGGTLTVGYLDGLAEALAKAGYHVVGINFRGSGKSTGPSEGVTLQTNADDVVGVIQALKLGPVHVIGNDFGNRVARMMAASQPFISGAISKTVNLPNEATVQDIRDAYVQAWKMGLKCVAIYRDGSKLSQPLASALVADDDEDVGFLVRRMNDRRDAQECRACRQQ